MTEPSPTAAPLLIAPPPPGWAAAPPARTGPTSMATASLVLGIVALLFNAFMIPTILAIVFGAIALAHGTAGRVRAILGIVFGALGIVVLFVWAVVAIPLTLGAQHAAVASSMQSTITSGFASQGVTVTDVVCAVPTAIRAGAMTSCTAESAAGAPISIDVTFSDSRGDFTYRVAGA